MDDARLLAIELRANGGKYQCLEHSGQFNADDDVLFLLAIIARLRRLDATGIHQAKDADKPAEGR